MLRNNGWARGPLLIRGNTDAANQRVDMSWDVENAADCIVVQFAQRAIQMWKHNGWGGQTYTDWHTRDWHLDNAGAPVANPGNYPVTPHGTYDTLGFWDEPGFDRNSIQPGHPWDGGEFWLSLKASLYDASLGNAVATYQSPTNPPPVSGSTIEWGVQMECEFGVQCDSVVSSPGPGLP